MVENFINYVGIYNLGFILLLFFVYLLGTKKAIKNLDNRIACGVEENRGFQDICKVTGELKKMVSSLKTSNEGLTRNEDYLRGQIVKLQNDLRKVSGGMPEQKHKEIKILKKEVKLLKKQIKKFEEIKQEKTTTRTP